MTPRFADDISDLPTHGFGWRSLTWWGIIGFMVIEGAGFSMALATYFFLMNHQQSWPPEPVMAATPWWGTAFTLLMLVSEIPNSWIKKRAERCEIEPVRKGLLLVSAIGAVLLVLRAFEFGSLNVRWTENAYGSIVWALLLLHTTHILTDWVDTLVLTALMYTKHGPTGRRFVDVSENSLYWRFVWLVWLPIYLLLYWVPRWV
jgi:cytochrome c oxidase subunit III